uniref:Uncharacterized protein n=1 Tax=Arundo donax TaxID=35708 RepID=A0A0A9DR53_ARUDO
MSSEESSTTLNSRIVAMNQFIYKLQKENKLREKERNEAQNLLRLKEEELAQLRAKLKLMEGQEKAAQEEEINAKEAMKILKSEAMNMEQVMLRQQQELTTLKQRLQEVEHEKADARQLVQQDLIGGRLLARLSEVPAGVDQSMSMVMSMELDTGDQPAMQDVKIIKEDTRQLGHLWNHTATAGSCTVEQEENVRLSGHPEKVVLSTVFEEGDEEDNGLEEEVCKEVVEESFKVGITPHALAEPDDPATRRHRIQNIFRLCGNHRELAKKPKVQSLAKQEFGDENKSPTKQGFRYEDMEPAKQVFGDDNKEPSAWGAIETPMCDVKVTDSPVSSQLSPIVCQVVDETLSEQLKSCNKLEESDQNKENSVAGQKEQEGLLEVYIKWESSNLIKGLKLLQNSCLSDLRKLIEAHFEETGSNKQHQFIFLLGVRRSALSMSCFHPSVLCSLFLVAMSFINHHILSWKI